MQRLRATFTRSRTPTGSEMKTQSSLDVPKQVRSASFDEIKLEAQRFASTHLIQEHHHQTAATVADTTTTTTTRGGTTTNPAHFTFQETDTSTKDSFLQVPQFQTPYSKRSHSFNAPIALVASDDSPTFLEVPKSSSKSRWDSSTKASPPPSCIHCFYLEELENQKNIMQHVISELGDFSNASFSSLSNDDNYDTSSECSNDNDIQQLSHDDHSVPSHVPLIEVYHDDNTDNCITKTLELQILPQQSHGQAIEDCVATSDDEGLEESSECCHSLYFDRNISLQSSLSAPCNITCNVTPINGDYLPYDNKCLIQTKSSPTFPISPYLSAEPFLTPTSSIEFVHSTTINSNLIIQLQTTQIQTDTSNKTTNRLNETFNSHDISNDDESQSIVIDENVERPRRRSISRQEAIFIEPSSNSLENISQEDKQNDSVNINDISNISEMPTSDLSPFEKHVSVTSDIYLKVPDIKRDRAVSVDSCFSKLSSNKTEELKSNGIDVGVGHGLGLGIGVNNVGSSDGCDLLTVPNTIRSRSVDIVLPTNEQAYYKAVAMSSIYSSDRSSTKINSRRPIRIVPDWTENAIQGEHFWKPTSASGDLCCLNEECIKSGQRMKCSACQIIAHHNCIPIVNEKTVLACKPTFRDVGIRQYREQSVTHHHWVHRKMEKGKCKHCGKAIQSKLFGSKEIVALSCAWCHEVYHNKESCFNQSKIGEICKLGNYAPIIVPPSWIVKLPNKGNFKSSLRMNNKNNNSNGINKKARSGSSKRNKQRDERKEHRAFIVKPIPSTDVIPVIVFINPKSGGNQGVKLLSKFQHLLNPRQVFDLTQGGPKIGLEMFRKAPNLRILACGGDGTVGWVLSTLDQINPPIQPAPAVGVLPLGTGNDLARALGWGGGYTDEPIGKILREIGMSQTVLMDRWRLKVTPNVDATDDRGSRGKDNVPLSVINNYFSFGVDAHIALEFHEAREAHPEKFNSRLRNKMYYGQMGGKDLILRQYRNLSQWITLECDGTDYTSKLKDAGCHAVLFLNIPSYGGGTHPWNESFGQSKSSIDDGLIEVVGLTTYQLPMLQAGMHGTCICQCRTARIITNRTIPMQVDGEACRVKPSIIEMELLNKAVMLAKRKHGRGDVQVNPLEKLQLTIIRITMDQYERFHYDKEMLRKLSNKLGVIEIESQCDLEQVRNMLNAKFEESTSYPRVSQDWCFIDCCTAEYYFRIDRAQEHLHYICDIAVDELYILDHEAATMPQTPDQERSFAAYSQRHMQNDQNNTDNNDEDLAMGFKPIRVQKWKSREDRLFSFDEDVFGPGISPLLEQTSDAILLAAQTDNSLMLRLLHEQGYSLQTTNKKGQSALHLACKYNHPNIIRYIILRGSHRLINIADKEKRQTALHVAAENGRQALCVMLVAAGANIVARDTFGNTPMMTAFNNGFYEMATYLECKPYITFIQHYFYYYYCFFIDCLLELYFVLLKTIRKIITTNLLLFFFAYYYFNE